MARKLSAQLWSVQDYTSKDFFATLEALAKIGYSGVEFAGYGNIAANDMKRKLQELNLTAISAHVGIEKLQTQLDFEINYLLTLGAKYIVCPGAEVNSVENALKYAEIFNKIGEKANKEGLTFAYHNHDYEFKLDQGQYPLEVLFDNVNPLFVKQQPDVFWVAYAGLDANDYLTKHIGRCPIIHLKQLENMTTKRNVNAGDGILDFKYLMDLSPLTDFVYEQEEFEADSLESMKLSFESMVTL